MNISRAKESKNNDISSVKPPLPTRLQSKHSTNHSKEKQILLSSISNQNNLDNIVHNLSIICKQSEEILISNKTLRRTSSLHLTNQENLSNSNIDLSRLNIQRRSLRNIEKYSGIKCSLPSGTLTIPNTFKNLEKHSTPTKIKLSSSIIDNQITPTNQKIKSPWRLRFEKILNHQELTPLSSTIAFTTIKENRTPSFRFPQMKNKSNKKTY